jgi:hypothetical protein
MARAFTAAIDLAGRVMLLTVLYPSMLYKAVQEEMPRLPWCTVEPAARSRIHNILDMFGEIPGIVVAILFNANSMAHAFLIVGKLRLSRR